MQELEDVAVRSGKAAAQCFDHVTDRFSCRAGPLRPISSVARPSAADQGSSMEISFAGKRALVTGAGKGKDNHTPTQRLYFYNKLIRVVLVC